MPDDFTSDGILILRSPTFDFICGGDATLDLHDDDGNVVLRIAFRRETNKILFNTGWEVEEERVDIHWRGRHSHNLRSQKSVPDPHKLPHNPLLQEEAPG